MQLLPLPHCGGRAVAGLAEVKGVKLIVASLYLNTGGTVKLEDRRLLSQVAPPILASALPFIIAADWNASPSALAASGFLLEM
eukprot:9520839-Prorocentrum_lima.AAC.1